MGSRVFALGMIAVAASCILEPLRVLGRRCSAQEPCAPGAVCDTARAICVSARDAATEGVSFVDLWEADASVVVCAGKAEGESCDDGLYCTVNEACRGGVCAGTPRDCSAPGTVCRKGACSEAQMQCVLEPQPDGAPCTNGRCYQGSCCTGCWTGSACVAGGSAAACGGDGHLCGDCTSTECRSSYGGATCSSLLWHRCGMLTKPDGTSCGGGQCRAGACCQGCWDGQGCQLGSFDTHCGTGGAACMDCTSECRTASSCSDKVCLGSNKPDGTTCKGGVCRAGICCTGCVDGTACYAGTATSHCGAGGGTCKTCSTTLTCKKAACSSGNCTVVDADGTSCSGGICHSGACCTGCWDGSACRPGNTDALCGTAGAACTACTAPAVCTSGTCQ